MRWVLVVSLAACARSAPPPALAARHEARVAIQLTAQLVTRDYRELQLVALPPLPAKRGFDRREETTCRAHHAYAERVARGEIGIAYEQRAAELHRFARIALQAGGDCRIDADALFAEEAPVRIGGCTGASPEEALVAWQRVAALATTPARRAAALHNVAALRWRLAMHDGTWIDAGDAYVRAADADPSDPALARIAVDAYENALRAVLASDATIDLAQRRRVVRGLARIHDGDAGDRARALRTRLDER